jgi:hypothetical protein
MEAVMRSALLRLFALALPLLVAACSGGPASSPTPAAPTPTAAPSGAPSVPASGGLPSANDLCALLTPLDWSQFQFSNATQPRVNSDAPGDAYCVYAGQSGSSGGLELDSFVSASVADAQGTFNTMAGDMAGAETVDLPGADEALISPNIDGTFGAIAVRAGRFAYTISLPTSDSARVQLETLARLVISRAQAYR